MPFLRSKLIQNIGALTFLQATNYLAPLLTIPYLTRVLGAEAFGLMAFVQVLMAWLVIVVNYGFPWSATRDIAAIRDDPDYVSRLFSANWAVQWMLTALAGLVLAIAVFAVPQLRQDAAIYFAGYSIVVSTVLFPVWLMQGLERLREVAAIQICGRLALLTLVFVLVRGPEDVALAVFAQGAGGIVAGIICLAWLRLQAIVRFVMPTSAEIWQATRNGGRVFVSQIAISFYTTFIPTALALASDAMMVGQYMVADRARGAAQSMLIPISQALFPRMSFLFGKHDLDGALRLVRYSVMATLIISGSASLAIFMLADWIVLILGGPEFTSAIPVLRWLAAVPLCVGLSNLFGVQIMLPRGKIRAFNTILISAAVLGVAMIFPMASWRGAEGAAMTILIVEIWVTAAMAFYLGRIGLVGKKAGE